MESSTHTHTHTHTHIHTHIHTHMLTHTFEPCADVRIVVIMCQSPGGPLVVLVQWVEAKRHFEEAEALIELEGSHMWSLFWAAHQVNTQTHNIVFCVTLPPPPIPTYPVPNLPRPHPEVLQVFMHCSQSEGVNCSGKEGPERGKGVCVCVCVCVCVFVRACACVCMCI